MFKICNKLHNSSGESISETLIALLIIVLGMTMLAGSIVSAANVNKKVKDAKTAFVAGVSGTPTPTPVVSKINIKYKSFVDLSNAEISTSETVKIYTTGDSNKYQYYEYLTPTPTSTPTPTPTPVPSP